MYDKHKDLTQKYSTWGDKLLQHTDVLFSIQNLGVFKPITVQLAPCEACDSDCPFCSVSRRPLRSYMPFPLISQCLKDFKKLGAKSVEITGGGNPMLYRDRESRADINDIIRIASELGYDVGIITNSERLTRLDPSVADLISWIRISLIKLDEGKEPEDYDFCGFPSKKIGFSYIIYDGVEKSPRLGRPYKGTIPQTIKKIAKLIELHPEVKFVRIAGNALIKGYNEEIREKYKPIIDAIDKYSKFFIKDIREDDGPFNDGCFVGMIRPYVATSPHGDGQYYVYICNGHVLNTRTYDTDYALCKVQDLIPAWQQMNELYKEKGYPYQVKGNCGINWESTCKLCFYKNNNKILYTVAQDMPDKNFA